MELPQDPAELKKFIAARSDRYTAAIEAAAHREEIEKLRQRLEVLEQAVPQLKSQSETLHGVGDKKQAREAWDFAKSLEKEAERIVQRIAELERAIAEPARPAPKATAAVQPKPEPAQPAVVAELKVVPAVLVEQKSEPKTEPKVAKLALKPTEVVRPSAAEVKAVVGEIQASSWQPRWPGVEGAKLYDEVSKAIVALRDSAPHLDQIELECRINLYIGQLRMATECIPPPILKLTLVDSATDKLRGVLMGLCKKFLIPYGYYVDALASKFETDWPAHVENWKKQLQQRIDERAAEEKQRQGEQGT